MLHTCYLGFEVDLFLAAMLTLTCWVCGGLT